MGAHRDLPWTERHSCLGQSLFAIADGLGRRDHVVVIGIAVGPPGVWRRWGGRLGHGRRRFGCG